MRFFMMVFAGASVLLFAGCCGLQEGNTVSVNEPGMPQSQECGGYVLIPAKYETVCEQVTVEAAGVRKVRVDAEYKTCSDTVVTTPGRWIETPVAATTKDVTEQVLVSPARREWRRTDCVNVNLQTGEQRGDAFCLVEVPAVYETRTRCVPCTPASVKREWVPAVYQTVDRQVLVCAAYDKEVPIDAKCESRSKQVLVEAARWEWRWGTECPPDEHDRGPRSTESSPPPPFPVAGALPAVSTYGTRQPSGTVVPASMPSSWKSYQANNP